LAEYANFLKKLRPDLEIDIIRNLANRDLNLTNKNFKKLPRNGKIQGIE